MAKFAGQTSKFWIVVSDETGMSYMPYRHGTEDSAFAEAQRLSREHQGAFYVFEAKGASKRMEVITRKFDSAGDDIPF